MYNLRQIERVWNRAATVEGNDPRMWRKDFAGAWIRRDMFGVRSPYGWTVCRLNPAIRAIDGAESNLIAAHWRNYKMKGDDYPSFKSILTSDGVNNVEKVKSWRVK